MIPPLACTDTCYSDLQWECKPGGWLARGMQRTPLQLGHTALPGVERRPTKGAVMQLQIRCGQMAAFKSHSQGGCLGPHNASQARMIKHPAQDPATVWLDTQPASTAGGIINVMSSMLHHLLCESQHSVICVPMLAVYHCKAAQGQPQQHRNGSGCKQGRDEGAQQIAPLLRDGVSCQGGKGLLCRQSLLLWLQSRVCAAWWAECAVGKAATGHARGKMLPLHVLWGAKAGHRESRKPSACAGSDAQAAKTSPAVGHDRQIPLHSCNPTSQEQPRNGPIELPWIPCVLGEPHVLLRLRPTSYSPACRQYANRLPASRPWRSTLKPPESSGESSRPEPAGTASCTASMAASATWRAAAVRPALSQKAMRASRSCRPRACRPAARERSGEGTASWEDNVQQAKQVGFGGAWHEGNQQVWQAQAQGPCQVCGSRGSFCKAACSCCEDAWWMGRC